jgi:lipopolysaccharide biosynthesis glycosyltransferase
VEKYCDVIVMKFDCHPLVNRIYALEFMSSTYDSILYLDCDVLAYGDINNLFCYEDAVMYMEEPWHYNRNTMSGMIDTYYFTEDEKNNTYGNYHPINSGHFSVSGKYKDEFFVTYKGKYETRINFSWGQDQSCLNYIVRTNMIKSKVYGKNTIGISTHLSSEEYKNYDLIHFAGHGDRVELMRKLCEKM